MQVGNPDRRPAAMSSQTPSPCPSVVLSGRPEQALYDLELAADGIKGVQDREGEDSCRPRHAADADAESVAENLVVP